MKVTDPETEYEAKNCRFCARVFDNHPVFPDELSGFEGTKTEHSGSVSRIYAQTWQVAPIKSIKTQLFNVRETTISPCF